MIKLKQIKIKKLFRKPIFWFLLVIALLIITGIVSASRGKNSSFDFVEAEIVDELIQEVNVTGRVKPSESADLAFEMGGKVAGVFVNIGDKVVVGQNLVSLDSADTSAQYSQKIANIESARAQLQQYQAALDIQLVKLDELKQGARPEEIQIAQTKVDNAKKSLDDAEKNLQNIKDKADIDLDNLYDDIQSIFSDVYTKADYAINQQIDDLFFNDSSDNPQLSFSTNNSQVETNVEEGRGNVTGDISQIWSELLNISSEQASLDQAVLRVENHLVIIRDFLNQLSSAVNSAVGISQTVINTYQGYVNNASASINTAIASVSGQRQLISSQKALNQSNISIASSQVNTARNTLTLAENDLTLSQAGATEQQIKSQEAQVRQAEANVASQQARIKQTEADARSTSAQLSKTIIKSPINGVVSKQEAKAGEIVASQVPIVSVISEADFEIEANVPESDIAKVNPADYCDIFLDAFMESSFFGHVVSIDPAQQIIGGVIYYKIRVGFDVLEEQIRSGITADVTIVTDKRENVLAIPRRAVTERGDKKIVKVVNGNSYDEVEVETGLEGISGDVEILSGVKEGDRVITLIKK